jgi:transposase
MASFDRITSNPNILNGRPTIRGMRLSVRRVVEALAESVAEVARDLKLRGRLLYAWRDKVRTGGPAALRERGRPRKGGMAVAAPAVAAAGEGDLARAQRRVAELERKIGQQQVDLDFFRRALRHVREGQ